MQGREMGMELKRRTEVLINFEKEDILSKFLFIKATLE